MTTGVPRLASPKYRPDIDGLRAFAVLAVVAFHAFPDTLTGGFTGVDVFFVVSGYLISTIIFENLERGTFSFAEFYARRVRRIFPALALVLAACLVFGWFALLADEYRQLGKHIAAAAGFVSNFVLWGEAGYFDNAANTKPLLHLWSLGIEEQFYLVWPLVLWLIWRSRFSAPIIIGLVASASFLLNVMTVRGDAVAAFYAPQTRFWELLSGSLLAWVTIHGGAPFIPLQSAAWRNACSIAGLSLVGFGAWSLHPGIGFPGWWAVIPVAGTLLIISAGPDAWINRTILANRVAVWVGLVSYPLYLWHWPLLSFARIVEGETPTAGIRVAAVALSVVLAWLTYRLVELPIRNGVRFGRVKVAALSSAMAVLLAAGIATTARDGFPNRASLDFVGENAAQLHGIGEDDKDSNEACKAKYKLIGFVRYCNVAGSAPGIALIGDSHARALYSEMAALLKERGEGLLNVGGRLLLGVATYPAGNDFEQQVYMGGIRATEMAARDPSIRTVIMVSRTHQYAIQGVDRVFRLLDHPDITDRKRVFEIGLRKTLDAFAGSNKTVIFVIDNPLIDFDPRACLAGRPLTLRGREKSPCAISKDQYLALEGWHREIVFSTLRDYPNVRVFDAPAHLCDNTWCWVARDGKILYRDLHHLSSEGATLISRGIIDVMDGKPSKILN